MSPKFRLPRRTKPEPTETTETPPAPEGAAELALEPTPEPTPELAPDPASEPEPAAPAPVSPAVAIMAGAYPTPAPQPPAAPGSAVIPEETAETPGTAAVQDALALLADEDRALLSWIDDDGYPVNVDVEVEVKTAEGFVRFIEPPGFRLRAGAQMAITSSHIYPLAEGGFDERSHVTVWGLAVARPRGRFAVSPARAWIWDQGELPPLAAYERGIPQARRYYRELSAERRLRIRPELDGGQLWFRAAHSQFLGLAMVPVLVGLAVAARNGPLENLSAILTIVAAALLFTGLSDAGGVFDPLADSSVGAERNAAAAIREMPMLAAGCLAGTGAIAVFLAITRGSTALMVLYVAGLISAVASEFPPLRAAIPGTRPVAAAIIFGPALLLGAYVVEIRGAIPLEAFVACLPIGLLAGLIAYLDEIMRGAQDLTADKRSVPIDRPRWRATVGFDVPAIGSFLVIAVGVGTGVFPIPALLALLALPLSSRIHRDLGRFHDNRYGLVPCVAANIRMHITVGLLLFAGYAIALAVKALTGMQPFLWR